MVIQEVEINKTSKETEQDEQRKIDIREQFDVQKIIGEIEKY